MKFKVVLEEGQDGWIVAKVPSLPGCFSQGKTEQEVIQNIRGAIDLHVSSLAEEGLPLRMPKNVKTVEVAFQS